jgi:hypothetical protein
VGVDAPRTIGPVATHLAGAPAVLTPELWRETYRRVVAWFERWLAPDTEVERP